jgi:HPt (histidine-containing phosphotransfer) domain-containing protein
MVDQELIDLKREFLAEAQEKVREMQSALSGDRSSATLDRLAYLAHQLKGSGGSYGYQRISTDAAAIEKAIERITAGDGSQDAAIKEYVVSLGAEIDLRASEL